MKPLVQASAINPKIKNCHNQFGENVSDLISYIDICTPDVLENFNKRTNS